MATFCIDPQEFSGGAAPHIEASDEAFARPRLCVYAGAMTGQSKRVRASPKFITAEQQFLTPTSGAEGVEAVLAVLEGRWKLLILFHLFGGKLRRFSELERAIPAVSQKMLIQQLRQLELDGIVHRIVHPQVPPKVEYGLTGWGQALCPVLDALLKWAGSRAKL